LPASVVCCRRRFDDAALDVHYTEDSPHNNNGNRRIGAYDAAEAQKRQQRGLQTNCRLN